MSTPCSDSQKAPGRGAVVVWMEAALQQKPDRNHGYMVELESREPADGLAVSGPMTRIE